MMRVLQFSLTQMMWEYWLLCCISSNKVSYISSSEQYSFFGDIVIHQSWCSANSVSPFWVKGCGRIKESSKSQGRGSVLSHGWERRSQGRGVKMKEDRVASLLSWSMVISQVQVLWKETAFALNLSHKHMWFFMLYTELSSAIGKDIDNWTIDWTWPMISSPN